MRIVLKVKDFDKIRFVLKSTEEYYLKLIRRFSRKTVEDVQTSHIESVHENLFDSLIELEKLNLYSNPLKINSQGFENFKRFIFGFYDSNLLQAFLNLGSKGFKSIQTDFTLFALFIWRP